LPLRDSVAKSGEGGELAELSRSLRGDAEQLADEFHLGYYISFAALLTLPFRIMSMASMPRKVRHAVGTDP
jgi:hypothetical protein